MFVKLLAALVSLALLYNIIKKGIPFLRRPQPETPDPVPTVTEEGAAPAAPATPAPMAVATGDKEKDWRDHPASELVTLLMVTLTFMSFTAYIVGLPGFLNFSIINDFLDKFTSANLGLIHELYFDTDNHYRHELWLITWSIILFVWLKYKTRKTDWNKAAGILKFLVLMGLLYVLLNSVTDFTPRKTVQKWLSPYNSVHVLASSAPRTNAKWQIVPGSQKTFVGKGTDHDEYELKLARWGHEIKRGQLVVVKSPGNKPFYVGEGKEFKKCFSVYTRVIDFTPNNIYSLQAYAEKGEKLEFALYVLR